MEAVVTIKLSPHELELIVESLVNYASLRKDVYGEVPINERTKYAQKTSEIHKLAEHLT